MASAVPVYEIPQKQNKRFERIVEEFQKQYGGRKPSFFARACGRVNLIGEHIDYCGYAVLPMAVEQDIVIAAAKSDTGTLKLANTDPLYTPYECKTTEIEIDKANPKWYHYFLCGYKGILDHFEIGDSTGIELVLDGTIPPSAGMSSSSALVCCAAMTTMRINNKQLSKLELSELCQHCERHIGTEGGGMDQAIAFLAEPGTAKLIEFNPIHATDVRLPDGAVFVISNSCVQMNKAATDHFNVRVAECRLATQVLAKSAGLASGDKIKKLGDVQAALGCSLDDMVEMVKNALHTDPYTKQEVCDILEITLEQLEEKYLSTRSRSVNSFKLQARALHVFSEASRVLQFKAMCEQGQPDAMATLGRLMSDSHTSCSQGYQCSCAELDELCQVAMRSGALGSRLTGAGWGGCAVSLVPTDSVDTFLAKVKEDFYDKDPHRASKVEHSLFATQPGGGAAFYVL